MQHNRDGEPNLLRLFGLFSLLLFITSSTVAAKSFEDFKRTQSSTFTQYKDAKDKEFSRSLRSAWQEYTSQKILLLYKEKKPKHIQSVPPRKIKSVGPLIDILLPKKEVPKKKPLVKESSKNTDFSFFGQYIALNIDTTIKSASFYPENQNGIVAFFDVLAHSDYEETLGDIEKYSKELLLNDWGKYLLVQRVSQEVYQRKDEQKLYTWFMLNKMGYDVKVGLSQKHIVLMHYSKKIIYSTPCYIFKKKRYYVVSSYTNKNFPTVYTYSQNYPNATKDLNLELHILPNFKKDLHSKTLSFKHLGKSYSIAYKYDKNLIDFMATYPQADYATYFNAAFSSDAYLQIAESIKRYIDGKKASVAINFVLHFVQKSFKYESDQSQFGREKVMFAYETLYYNSSDCEDRAILFAFLVKKLFHIGVVGVKYKNHMTVGLNIPMQGDRVKYARHSYVIADPTYIDANIGQSMPEYKYKKPEQFILLNH